MIGVLLSPKETFAAIASKPRWLGVMLVTMVMSSAAYYVILSSQDMQDAIVDQQVRGHGGARNRALTSRSPTSSGASATSPLATRSGIFVLGPLFGAAIAGIVTGIFSTLMGGNGTFKQVFAVMSHAGFIPAISALFIAGMLASGAKPVGGAPPGAISVSSSRCWRRHRFWR